MTDSAAPEPAEPADPAERITLRLTGAPAVQVQAQDHLLAAPDALLLAWLALEGPTARERLAALLWPDSSPEAARNALRQRLFRLRKQLGCEAVSGSTALALAAGVAHDLDDSSPLLGGLAVPESPELDAWLNRRRAGHRAAVRRQLEERIEVEQRCPSHHRIRRTNEEGMSSSLVRYGPRERRPTHCRRRARPCGPEPVTLTGCASGRHHLQTPGRPIRRRSACGRHHLQSPGRPTRRRSARGRHDDRHWRAQKRSSTP